MYVYTPRQRTSFSRLRRVNRRASAFSFNRHTVRTAPRRRQSMHSTRNGGLFALLGNTLLMQIFVLGFVTVSLLFSFQSLTEVGTTSVSAEENSEIRVYNNFQQRSAYELRDQSRFIQPVEAQVAKGETSQPDQANRTNQALYTVQSGDTLSTIAVEFETSANQISRLNNLTAEYSLRAGDIIRIRAE